MSNQEHLNYLMGLNPSGSSGSTMRTCTVRIIPPTAPVKTESRKRPLPPSSQQEQQTVTPFNPDDYGDFIPEDAPKPVCEVCSLAFMTWAAFEYHSLRYHIEYRPYRCVGCKNLAFHTEAEGRHHLAVYHEHPQATFALIKRTDFNLENDWLNCLMNAKTTDNMDLYFARGRLQEGLEMVEKVQTQLVRMRATRAQLPYCIRNEIDPIDVATEPEMIVEEVAVNYTEEFFAGQSIDYEYQNMLEDA